MKQKLLSAINEISSNSSLLTLDEASIKSGVVQRLLSVLGWNPFDVNEVKPEYTVESKRVDFSLRIAGMNKAFIEVKRPSEDLEPHQEQLLGYSFREGVKLAVLTNGLTWWFYLPLTEGNWEQRRFFAADFCEQDPEVITERLVSLLSKENIVSGDAIKNAEHLYRSRQKKNILKEALPKAWNKIISEPDDLLVELLLETTERLSGFRPETDEVEKFLRTLSQCFVSKPVALPGQTVDPKGPISVDLRKVQKRTPQESFEVTLKPASISSCMLYVKKDFRNQMPESATRNQKDEFTINIIGYGEVKAYMSQDRIKIRPSSIFRNIVNTLHLREHSRLTIKVIELFKYYEASKIHN